MIERVDVFDETGTWEKEIVVVGTAHVSQDSVDEVEAVIEREKPDTVAVELDWKRFQSLQDDTFLKEQDVGDLLRSGDLSLVLLQLVLSIYQRKLGDEFDLSPGEELQAAIAAANETGADLALIDRDISTTLQRARNQLTFTEKMKLVAGLVASAFDDEEITAEDIESLKDGDALQAVMDELTQVFPSLQTVFVDERDQYMAQKLLELEGEKIVAVVGAGHVNGILQYLREEARIEQVPRTGGDGGVSLRSVVKYGVPATIIGLFLYTLYTAGTAVATDVFLFWFLANGVLAAVGAAASLAHPVTILVAFITSPFTSLNPLLPAGLVAAYTEYVLNKPTGADMHAVAHINTFKALWQNRFTRLLLIFFLVNLGSAVGAYIAVGYGISLV